MKSCIYILVFIFIIISKQSYAINAVDYDVSPKDGLISLLEFKRFIYAKETKSLFSFDVDDEFGFSEKELQTIRDAISLPKITKVINPYLDIFKIDYEEYLLKKGVPIHIFAKDYSTSDAIALIKIAEENNKTMVKKEEKTKYKRGDFLLRSKIESISSIKKAKKLSKSSPAEISYIKNGKSENASWLLKGALMYPYKLDGSEKVSATKYLVPSLTFHQLRNSDEEKPNIDTLSFRLGYDSEVEKFITPLSYIGGGLELATNSDFDEEVASFDFYFIPNANLPFLHTDRRIGPFMLNFSPTFIAEYGEVLEAGENNNLTQDETFSRVGANIDINMRLFSSKRYSLASSYNYFSSIGGELRDRKLFSLKLKYQLDETGNYFLTGGYANGDRTTKLEDEESWTIGLGVKY